MVSPSTLTLHGLCKRYGPGRLPRAEHGAVGAGYAAVSAAVFVAAVYASATQVIDSLGPAFTGPHNVLLAGLALFIFLPAAFLTGYLGWRFAAPRSPEGGALGGLLGAVATYGIALVLLGVPLTALELVTGTDPLRHAVFSWGVIYFAFLETWWAALPVGCLSGFVYVAVAGQY